MEIMFMYSSNLIKTALFIFILFISARLWGYIFSVCNLPKVIGEIFGGFLLGRTVLGVFFPVYYELIFDGLITTDRFVTMLYLSGMVMLMLISGFDIQKTYHSDDKKLITAAILGPTILPFIAGFLLPLCVGCELFTTALR